MPGADRQPADVLVGHARLGERRELVVEEPIVLVVGDEQGRVLPQFGVRQQRLEHGVHVVRPVVGGEGRVLAVTGRGDDPRHLRQLVALDVADERRQHVCGVGLAQRGRPGVGLPRGHRPPGRQRPGPAVAAVGGVELLVEPQRVVAVVAQEVVGEVAAVAHLVVGVDLPADSGLLQLVGVGGDLGRAGVGAEVDRVVVGVGDEAGRRAGPEVHPVRAGRRHDPLVVAVADGEGVGHRVLERDLVPGEVAHRFFGLGWDEVVPQAAVAGRVVAVPAVIEVGVDLVGELVREQVAEVGAGRIRLLEDAGPVLVGQGLLVAEPAHPAKRPEVVVEGAVLLHQDHHVLHVGDGPAPALRQRLGRGRAAVHRGARRGGAEASRRDRRSPESRVLQEAASAEIVVFIVLAHVLLHG